MNQVKTIYENIIKEMENEKLCTCDEVNVCIHCETLESLKKDLEKIKRREAV